MTLLNGNCMIISSWLWKQGWHFYSRLVIKGCGEVRNLHHFLKALVMGHKRDDAGLWGLVLDVMNGHSHFLSRHPIWVVPAAKSKQPSNFFHFMSCRIVKSLSHPFSSILWPCQSYSYWPSVKANSGRHSFSNKWEISKALLQTLGH